MYLPDYLSKLIPQVQPPACLDAGELGLKVQALMVLEDWLSSACSDDGGGHAQSYGTSGIFPTTAGDVSHRWELATRILPGSWIVRSEGAARPSKAAPGRHDEAARTLPQDARHLPRARPGRYARRCATSPTRSTCRPCMLSDRAASMRSALAHLRRAFIEQDPVIGKLGVTRAELRAVEHRQSCCLPVT